MTRQILAFAAATLLAAPALACSLPPPECTLENGQVAVLYEARGTTIMFSQHDPAAATYSETFVVVDCTTRQAVALGETTAPYGTPAHERHTQARYLMGDVVQAEGKPRLGRLYRALKRLDQRAKHFTLRKSHCGCDLPSLPPPPVSCPDF